MLRAVAVTDSTPSAQGPPISRPLIGERYEILALIGSGGMGNVYRARDLELDELCALKVLRPELSRSTDLVEHFRREVKLARRVTHPNVARVFDIGEHGGERILTMELVEGEPLSRRLAGAGRLPVAEVVSIASALCAGLGAAHAAGVVHRDLKPDNVLLERSGRVVITDFGIARAAAAPDAARTAFVWAGTPAYMAPEQVEPGAAVDARTDIYALGVLLYEACTGERPWPAATAAAIAAARGTQPPPDPLALRPDLPPGLAALVQRCMARRPEDRFPSAAAVADELAAIASVTRARGATPTPPSGLSTTVVSATVTPTVVSRQDRVKRVAVLPFRNAGPPEHDYLADGLTEDVIDALSMAEGLRVTSRGVVMRYKGSALDPREVGRDLGVQAVVEGTVRRAEGMVRIAARLASVDDGVQLWAKRFDRPDAELFGVSDDAARAIAEALTVELKRRGRPVAADAEAMDLYLRARVAYHRFFGNTGGEESLPLFERALARAPDDPRVLAGYAMSRCRVANPEGEGARSAADAATRAVELDPGSPHAHLAVGAVTYQAGDEAGAVSWLRRALLLSPVHAEAHDLLGRILSETHLRADARLHLSTAIGLEPDITLARLALARLFELDGDPAEADRVAPPGSEAAIGFHARATLWRRDAARARQMLPTLKSTTPALVVVRAMLVLAAGGPPPYEALALLGVRMQLRGRASIRARAFFHQLEAESAAFLGDRDRALDAIRRASEHAVFDVAWLDLCPLFADLRDDPAFALARAPVAARAAAVEAAYRAAMSAA
jgi:serine/threonine-protein kinase